MGFPLRPNRRGINLGLPQGLSSKESNAVQSLDQEDSLEQGMALLQYSGLENPMDRGVTPWGHESRTDLSD